MDLSVVMPVHNGARTIEAQLEALLAQQRDRTWELLVVDNLSTDATTDIVKSYVKRDGRVRLIDATQVARVTYARNVGVAAAASDAIAMCDADDVVGRSWVGAMIDALREHDYVGGPLELRLLNPEWVVDSRGHAWASQPGDFAGIFHFAHCSNIGIRRTRLARLGGFDEGLSFGEDVELGLRAWRAGVPLHFAPEAVVHYRYRTQLRDLWRQAYLGGQVKPYISRLVRATTDVAPPRDVRGRDWLWLAANVRLLASRAGRARWLWVAAARTGVLTASALPRTSTIAHGFARDQSP
jgi:glycosyltransferase involved in cell wall biosynthesis